MSTIFPGSASAGQIFDGYTFNGTAWNINGIDLTENYLEESSASATYLTQVSASNTYLTQTSASTIYQPKVANISDTEIGYLNGVTSSIQTQLDDKSTASKTETLTNKTLTTPTINGPAITAIGQTPTIHGIYLPAPHNIIFEGTTANEFETTLEPGEPTADRTITLPDQTGTVQLRVTDVSDTEIGYLNGVTSAIQTQIDSKLSISSASTTYATKTELNNIDLSSASAAAVAAIVDSAPATLDTLNELAAALGDDANYASTITTALGNKLDISSASTTYATKTELNNIDALPSQSGNSGKYLTTSGSVASWGTLDLSLYLTQSSASTTYATTAALNSINGESDQFILPGQIFG